MVISDLYLNAEGVAEEYNHVSYDHWTFKYDRF